MGTKSRGKASKGCDLFLSLHANWAERENADHVVIFEMLDKPKHDLAVILAKTIQSTMGTKEPYDIRTRQSDSGNEWYGVLNGCDQVGTVGFILEHSFYSNKAMATWMMSQDNIEEMAQAEADAIATYYGVKKPVKTYEVVTNLNKYNSETDAKAKKNSTGKYAPGTYYIYTKYPDGKNGMLNITTDKTGKSAGSWINPAENTKTVVSTAPATTTSKTETKPTLRKGDKNDSVKTLQTKLKELGCDCGSVDGSFGGKTETQVKAFQKERKLTQNGICDKKVWDAIESFKPYKVKVNVGKLNVRAGHGVSHKVIKTVTKGDTFTIVYTHGSWSKIKDGAGWVWTPYIKKI
jgi:hypothetical protein